MGMVGVAVGSGGQPVSAAFTAAISSEIDTEPLPLRSAAKQVDGGVSPSAMRTALISSVIPTPPLLSQSAGQTAPAGLQNRKLRMNAETIERCSISASIRVSRKCFKGPAATCMSPRGPWAGLRRGELELADATVERIGNIQVAIGIERQPERPVELRRAGRATVAAVAFFAGAGDGGDRATAQVDNAYAMIVGVGDVQLAVGPKLEVLRERQRRRARRSIITTESRRLAALTGDGRDRALLEHAGIG